MSERPYISGGRTPDDHADQERFESLLVELDEATAAGGSFDSSATVGQADAGQMSGGGFTVQGGFWPESASTTPPSGDEIFQDGFEGD